MPTALVTGANQGIGLEVCRQLRDLGYAVMLTSRNEHAGRKAADRLGADYRKLDVADAGDIAALAAGLAREGRTLDVLVNNAGVSLDGFNDAVVRETVGINFLGALHVTEALLPVINDGASIVLVASRMGELHAYAPEIRARFAAPDLTRDELVALVDEFLDAVAGGRQEEEGWPTNAYRVSKAAVIALAKVLARDLAPRGIRIVAACPGWVRTRMGRKSAPLSVEEGADSIVWAAVDPAAASGGFYRARKPAKW